MAPTLESILFHRLHFVLQLCAIQFNPTNTLRTNSYLTILQDQNQEVLVISWKPHFVLTVELGCSLNSSLGVNLKMFYDQNKFWVLIHLVGVYQNRWHEFPLNKLSLLDHLQTNVEQCRLWMSKWGLKESACAILSILN